MATPVPERPLPKHLQKLLDLLPLNKPVHRSEIEKAYGKANYARRIRKLIHEYGWDIERRRGTSGANDDWYTRTSERATRPQRIRREVSPVLRKLIYQRDRYTCRVCHRALEGHASLQPQCDHKVPAERGGASDSCNLQTLCTECNLKKRQACKHCALSSCEGCPLAYPELFATRYVVLLSESAERSLNALARTNSTSAQVTLQQIVEESLEPYGNPAPESFASRGAQSP